jgi:hypothetical protein
VFSEPALSSTFRDQRAGLAVDRNECDLLAVTEEQTIKARRVICSYAEDVADAETLMMACGIHPKQTDDGYLTGPPGLNKRSCR